MISWFASRARRTAILIIALSLLLAGCWDRIELNDMAFVVAIGVDVEDNGQYRVAVQIPLTGKLGGPEGGEGGSGGSGEIFTNYAIADSLMEAYTMLQNRMPRRLKFGHYRVLVMGEEYARQGMKGLFDLLARKSENRLSVFPLVAKGKAFDLLQTQPSLEKFPSEGLRELAKTGEMTAYTLKDTAYSLSHTGGDPVLIYMGSSKLTPEEGEPIEDMKIFGYAQFSSDRMIDIFDRDAAIGLNWLRGIIKPYTVAVNLDEDNRVVFNVISSQTKLLPEVDDHNRLSVDVQVTARLELSENKSDNDLIEDHILEKVKADAADIIHGQITEAVNLIKKNGADSANIGLTLYRKQPAKWPSLQEDWPEILKAADFQIQVVTDIEQVGLISENIVRR
ncbi:Ger(x)C family spore germination protein [Paenibacillus senegalensis]|uniref:Ger(x)C family spore germination protein n=1 Tax=Paenibacillus senegalensis TaxID=1465766 RepID=UPI000289D742|nr:Ger(x)C family spore germination protein [Paenibacillus senegalensis]